MSTIQTNNFSVIEKVLEKSVDQLNSQNREDAINTILGASKQIQFLSDTSIKMEAEYKKEQQKITDTICSIIESEATVRDSYIDTQKRIDALSVNISAKNTDKQQLMNAFNSLERELNKDIKNLQGHKKRLDELNNSSAKSILRSICILGMDRAIIGVQSLVNDDTGRIRRLTEEIAKYKNSLDNNYHEIEVSASILKVLYDQKNTYEVKVEEYKKSEANLNQQENACRQNLAILTNIALFYGKLLIMLNQIHHRIDDVQDIVSQLNESAPTIAQYDSSGEGLISLKDALIRFDKMLESA